MWLIVSCHGLLSMHYCLNICLFKKALLALIAALGSILAQCIRGLIDYFVYFHLLWNDFAPFWGAWHGLWKYLKSLPHKLMLRPEGETFSPPEISECSCWLDKLNPLVCSGAEPADTTCEPGTLRFDKNTVSCRIYFLPLRKEFRNCHHKGVLQMNL